MHRYLSPATNERISESIIKSICMRITQYLMVPNDGTSFYMLFKIITFPIFPTKRIENYSNSQRGFRNSGKQNINSN